MQQNSSETCRKIRVKPDILVTRANVYEIGHMSRQVNQKS